MISAHYIRCTHDSNMHDEAHMYSSGSMHICSMKISLMLYDIHVNMYRTRTYSQCYHTSYYVTYVVFSYSSHVTLAVHVLYGLVIDKRWRVRQFAMCRCMGVSIIGRHASDCVISSPQWCNVLLIPYYIIMCCGLIQQDFKFPKCM